MLNCAACIFWAIGVRLACNLGRRNGGFIKRTGGLKMNRLILEIQ